MITCTKYHTSVISLASKDKTLSTLVLIIRSESILKWFTLDEPLVKVVVLSVGKQRIFLDVSPNICKTGI